MCPAVFFLLMKLIVLKVELITSVYLIPQVSRMVGTQKRHQI